MPSAFSEHAYRVSALAAEFALRAGLSRGDQTIAADAALLVDYPPHRLTPPAIASLFAVAGRDGRVSSAMLERYAGELIRNVEAAERTLGLRGPREPVPEMISAAEAIAGAYEPYLELDADPTEYVRTWFRRRKEEGLHSRRSHEALLRLPVTRRPALLECARHAAVYPAIAVKAMRKAATEDASFSELASIAAQDQTLAGNLIRAANSALNPAVSRVATIRHAITYVGLDRTRRILTAAAFRPLFASRSLSQLWQHSLTVASWCESLARSTGAIDVEEAFLCGLVHDIGRLIMMTVSGEAPVSLQRFKERGCDPAFAELVLFGCGHASLGADVLSRWNFPEHVSLGIAGHHNLKRRPSRHAALLCLAEAACPNDEQKSSVQDQGQAMEILGLNGESLRENRGELGPLAALTFAA